MDHTFHDALASPDVASLPVGSAVASRVLRTPTSFSQRRLWLLDRLLPVRAVYNLCSAQRLTGNLDVDALRRALNEVLHRHEALRTRFAVVDGEPFQEILPEVVLPLTPEELSHIPMAERESEARRRAQEEGRADFDLQQGPLFRARLLRLAPTEHWLVLAMHHIVTDAWSQAVLAREVSTLYAAFHRGEASPLSALPMQYSDYAIWQRRWLQGETMARQLDYWRTALADPPVLELPTDRPRPAIPSYRAGRVTFEIDADRTRALKRLARAENATLFMVLLAAYQVLLCRYSGHDDIAVGVPIANRQRQDVAELIGFFVNTLVLRGDLSGDPSFRSYVGRVRERALAAYSNQDLPFEKLVEELAPRRDPSRNPLFQAAFALQNTQPVDWCFPGIEVELLDGIAPLHTGFDLTLSIREAGGVLRARMDYARDLFAAETIQRMAQQWLTLLERIVLEPEAAVSRLPLMRDVERARLIAQAGNMRVSEVPAPPVPESTPEATQMAATAPQADPARDAGEGGTEPAEDRSQLLVRSSFAQAGLWFLQRLAPDSPVYNAVHAWRIQGHLDIAALEQALRWLVQRHESLRTMIVLRDGQPWQHITDAVDIALPTVSLAGIEPAAREREVLRRIADAGRQSFDLLRCPLFRTFLLRAEDSRHWLAMVLHHAIRDGASTAILCRELSLAYNAFRKGEAPDATPPVAQYRDYAEWQRDNCRGAPYEALVAFWRERLAGAPTTLDLPTERPRPRLESHAGDREHFTVDAARVAALRSLAREEGATLHMTMLAAYQLLLGRHANQDDILVGAPVAGRSRPEFDGVIGCFANTVVHRGDLSGDPTFRILLRRTRDNATDAYAHQELPLERLIEALAPRRDAGRHPLFQTMFTLQDAFDSCPKPLALDGAEAVPLDVHTGTSKVDLSLLLVRDGPQLLGAIEYATDLFTAPWARQLARQFLTLLQSVVENPDAPISRLTLMAAEAPGVALPATKRASPLPTGDDSLVARFSGQVRRNPTAPAVRCGDRTLSYGELEQRADALANALRDAGIAPGARVGICTERSIEEIVAVVGVLKAGGVYVPLDPWHPPERLASLLADAGAAAVVTTADVELPLAQSMAGSARPVIVLDSANPLPDAAPPDRRPAVDGESPAYVMYTSGSTGEPKGVVVPHRAIVGLVCDTDYVHVAASDVIAHLSNPAFDAATFEIWGALLNGACLGVIARDAVLSPRELAASFDRYGVTTFFLTTALFNLVARDAPWAFTGRTVLFGGEASNPRRVAAALADGKPARLLHVYGPTETTTFATCHEVKEVDVDAQTIPIGRPIANTEVYVLDRNGELVPLGVPGEIYIGGPRLALGYLHRPDVTAERFVPHRLARGSGARLYRTGDRARYRSGGSIEFLGRLDRQVKIRGHRVEPGEVEAALRALPQVRDAAIVVRGDTAETRRLDAYVTVGGTFAPRPNDLLRDLRRTLPAYMMPGGIVLLPSFPLTPNGKVDRAALPDPHKLAAFPGLRIGQVPPRDPLEQLLVSIWERLLEVREIGVEDSFFDLGGHSLLAAQMMDEVEKCCGVALPLTTLFTESTIAHLARALRGRVASDSPVVVVRAEGSRPPLFFLHGDFSGGGFYCHALARELGMQQPFYAVHPHGIGGSAVPDSIEAMAADLIQPIRKARPNGPYLIGGHCNGALVAVEIARQLVAQGEAVPLVLIVDAKAPWRQTPVFAIGESAPAGSRAPRTATADPPAPGMSNNVFVRYRRAIARYAPEQLPLRAAVFRSALTKDLRPSLGWSSVVTVADTRTIPGNHHSSITRHVVETGAQIRTCIERAVDARG